MKLLSNLRALSILFLVASWSFVAGCTSSFGPGYTINKQDIDVHFEPGPPPHIAIKSSYELTNNGTLPLFVVELRLPAKHRFKSSNVELTWDGQAISSEPSPDYPRNTLLKLPQPWTVSARHSLHIAMNLETPAPDEQSYLGFAPDAFFLPAEGWAAELLPAKGIFATGGAPPDKWNLTLHVPQGFVVHTSGDKIKTSKHGDETTVQARQRIVDIYPSVIAGRYVTKQIGSDRQKIDLWTRKPQDPGDIRAVSDSLIKTLANFNLVFGARSLATPPTGFFGRHPTPGKNGLPLWLAECPVIPGCFTERNPLNAQLLGTKDQGRSGEMISLDSAMIDPGPGLKKMALATAPALAASWLGYGQNPGFYEQDPPLSAFPAFAAAVGDEALNGAAERIETIRRALALVANNSSPAAKEDGAALYAKSFLFFYALQDRYGQETFRKAVRHMLDARRNTGFNLDDLIAAFDEEAHGNTAAFVRLWMKHPGVPADFRAKYENTSAQKNTPLKETTP
ncbi:MAG TPA: hypothetical protein VII37_09475 [Candidatus Acidoferrum sp.]